MKPELKLLTDLFLPSFLAVLLSCPAPPAFGVSISSIYFSFWISYLGLLFHNPFSGNLFSEKVLAHMAVSQPLSAGLNSLTKVHHFEEWNSKLQHVLEAVTVAATNLNNDRSGPLCGLLEPKCNVVRMWILSWLAPFKFLADLNNSFVPILVLQHRPLTECVHVDLNLQPGHSGEAR